ncbi:Uncharacterised protein [Vibrio cholerae]|nr:Uncharacterised protein [Vibrio cholerae]
MRRSYSGFYLTSPQSEQALERILWLLLQYHVQSEYP